MEMHSFRIVFSELSKALRYPQDIHTRKLGEITGFYAVVVSKIDPFCGHAPSYFNVLLYSAAKSSPVRLCSHFSLLRLHNSNSPFFKGIVNFIWLPRSGESGKL